MQQITVSRLYSLFLVQCILTTSALTAPMVTAKLLREIQKRQSADESSGSKSENEQFPIVHDYAKTVQINREFWRSKNCELDFQCAPVSRQHCTDQIAKVAHPIAFEAKSARPFTSCDLDFQMYIEDLKTITGVDISLYIRTDNMNSSLIYDLFLIQKDLTPQVITNRTLDSNCGGWQTFRHIPKTVNTKAMEFKEGDNKITIFVAIFVQLKGTIISRQLTCAEAKKLIFIDVNEQSFFSYIQSKNAQSEVQGATKSDPPEEKTVTDGVTTLPTPADTSSMDTTTTENTTENSPSTTDSTSTESLSTTTESLSTKTESTAKDHTETESSASPTTENESSSSSNDTESPTEVTTVPSTTTEWTTEAATTENTLLPPLLSEEESFLPMITVFINPQPVTLPPLSI